MEIRAFSTRMELNRLKGRLQMAKRGHKLLKDKRRADAQVFELIRENKDLREQVEAQLSSSFANFLLASAVMSAETLERSRMYPNATVNVDVQMQNIMSIQCTEGSL